VTKARAAPASRRPARASALALPREVRIIGGAWKRSKLAVADRPGLRPTPDRVRETLFNWLGQTLEGWRCVDAFAGAGALGFEAASRGAAEVVLVERDAALVASLVAARQRLQADAVRVERADAVHWMARAPAAAFDLVFLDPPFDSALLGPALDAAVRVVVEGGRLRRGSCRSMTPTPDRAGSPCGAAAVPERSISSSCARLRAVEPGATLRRSEAGRPSGAGP
jgi:16S rRNA (guanine(966)-N(2))-methyltransferase RsmD